MSSFLSSISKKLTTSGSNQAQNQTATPMYLQPPYCHQSLVMGHLRNIVLLPKHLQSKQYQDEWVAVTVSDFFNNISLLYELLSAGGICDGTAGSGSGGGNVNSSSSGSNASVNSKCQVMLGPGDVEYQWWMESQKRNVRVSAPQYFDYMFSQIQHQLNDSTQFPSSPLTPFPSGFLANVVKPIMKHYLRFFGHIYHVHFDKMVQLAAEAHLNTLFCHLVVFIREFKVMDDKEMKKEVGGALMDLVDTLQKQITTSSSSDVSQQ